jgi:LAO/AO transport system kinase
VVNKADRDGAEHTRRALQMMLDLGTEQSIRHHGQNIHIGSVDGVLPPGETWRPTICSTVAITGQGVDELVRAITNHYHYLKQSGGWAERERIRAGAELDRLLRDRLVTHLLERIGAEAMDRAISQIVAREVDAHMAAFALLADARIA